jgi:hypothetical protein
LGVDAKSSGHAIIDADLIGWIEKLAEELHLPLNRVVNMLLRELKQAHGEEEGKGKRRCS